ncbi:MAG: diaminobutyrate--2-oxoglutarate transaminase [Planctomycetaceae bacterium]
MTDIFERRESEVRGYCRSFPTVFQTASGSWLVDEDGQEFIDFFAGAGALNYGHNHPVLKMELLQYLKCNGVMHSLDMYTSAKRDFLSSFEKIILQPRDMDYKVMFPGPTGTNAVEAALKLARKFTGRHNVVSFTNGFHGMTLGSLALTGNGSKRAGAGVPLNNVTHFPYCGYHGTDADTISSLERFLEDSSSGLDLPAAFIVETLQAEGGVNVASRTWLRQLAEVAARFGVLLIVDDIQVGCGRTGPFFSFESFDIQPDIVCLSKSLSGFGLPLAVTLMKPELDVFDPGEHNGTFRGHNAAFVTARAALETFWVGDSMTQAVLSNAAIIRDCLLNLADEHDADARGRGMIQGVEFPDSDLASLISREAFRRGLIVETSGPADEVLKLLPPLNISEDDLNAGLDIIRESVAAVSSRDLVASGK